MDFNRISFKLRQYKHTVFINFIVALIFGIGLFIGVILYSNKQSFYYLFTFSPYLLIPVVLILFGPPYPLNTDEDSFLNSFENTLQSSQISEFSIGCIVIGPFAILSILFVTTKSTILVLIFQIISHSLIMLSFLFFTFVYYKPIPQDELYELKDEINY